MLLLITTWKSPDIKAAVGHIKSSYKTSSERVFLNCQQVYLFLSFFKRRKTPDFFFFS